MNTTLHVPLETTFEEQPASHPPSGSLELPALAQRRPRTSLLDRAAMWLGLRLVLWGTRPVPLRDSAPLHEQRREMLHYRRQLELQRARAPYGAWLHDYGR